MSTNTYTYLKNTFLNVPLGISLFWSMYKSVYLNVLTFKNVYFFTGMSLPNEGRNNVEAVLKLHLSKLIIAGIMFTTKYSSCW